MRNSLLSSAGLLLLMMGAPALAQSSDSLENVFSHMSGSSKPGCAMGVSRDGATILTRGYGAADLEHDVPITPSTIFEAGSVSKQFTAAAILLLAEDGKLQLSDDVRSFVPELPDYGTRITIDHLLNHTSGLRDWGSVMELAGWPRGTRAYTMDDVLAIIARQRKLNYSPGTEYSYTNSGYNLLAIIVQRVSGSSLADFTRQRIFEPLAMRSTSWRNDFRRVVRGRAIAYSPAPAGFAQAMPFEDAYGNGGLLTTVQDLLIWNEALSSSRLGAGVTERLAERSRLTDGRQITYGRGLFIQSYGGRPEISHGGATGGYRAWLGRYPESRVSIALLCNLASANAEMLAHRVADQFLPTPPPAPDDVVAAPPAVATGTFVNERTGMPTEITIENGQLRMARGSAFKPAGPNLFRAGRAELRYVNANRFSLLSSDGQEVYYRRVQRYEPSAAALAAFAGRYSSAEAGAEYVITQLNGKLVLNLAERPHMSIELQPAYQDAFSGSDGIYRFHRNKTGRVIALSAGSSRVRELTFSRINR